jgi:tRNA nucleotidyltransferase (CCA-adding enzyme)
MPTSKDAKDDPRTVVDAAIPQLARLREALADAPVYLVGGAVRDAFLGHGTDNLDLVVEGDAVEVARRLGGEAREHDRFGTATTWLDGLEIDVASARTETYPQPGALPEVEPATLERDLARRDFTINAMAIPLAGEPALIDPHDGRPDLDRGLLRVLHEGSFVDDPTRALRAARYAARFGFALESRTAELLREADLGTVSGDRVRAELLRVTSGPAAAQALGLVALWKLLQPRPDAGRLLPAADVLTSGPPWDEIVDRPRALVAAAFGPVGREVDLAGSDPQRPSEAVEAARAASPEELVLARALGAGWLDPLVVEWRNVALEIGGQDLLDAGVPEGPAVGRGLAAAKRRKLDGELSSREQELQAALEAAGEEPAGGDRR